MRLEPSPSHLHYGGKMDYLNLPLFKELGVPTIAWFELVVPPPQGIRKMERES